MSNYSPAENLKADLFLLHAPSVYDFRDRDDVLFAYLSDSDSVNVTSVFEMYPLGFLAIKERLRQLEFDVKIVNLASLMLMHPELNVERLLAQLEAPVFGLDLHWMAHCHGSIEVARQVKAVHPEALVMFGGISATYYAEELIQYHAVDMVVKGYDTLEPVSQIMKTVREGDYAFASIPNLLYKDRRSSNGIISTGFSHKPASNYNDVTVDWSFYQGKNHDLTTSKLIMTLPSSGCAYDCGWCGGSRYTFRNLMGLRKTLVQKNHDHIVKELRTLAESAQQTTIYALQCYSETSDRLSHYLDVIAELGYQSVSFEQYHLPEKRVLEKMAASTEAYIMLSPESHDPLISRLAGRGNYTMSEMEEWIPMALDAGIAGVCIWFFIGMPRQTPQSVLETVAYCERLLERFDGKRVIPLICPMVPFLDPGSRFFEEPHKHGYQIYHRTLEEHRSAMVQSLWHRRLNYDTQWMSRRQIQEVTYEAVTRLVEVKGEMGALPASVARKILVAIEETTQLLCEIERSLVLDGVLSPEIRTRIRDYNQDIFSHSSDQIIPVDRPFGGRWFDDTTIPSPMIDHLCAY